MSDGPNGPTTADRAISTTVIAAAPEDRRTLCAIGWVVAAFASFSCADAIIKWLSAGYPVLQLVFTMALFALGPLAALVACEGGLAAMRLRRPGLVALRAGLLVGNSVLGFSALKLLPLADAYTVFFAGPMMITALAVPLLKERVGWRRWSAVVVGFLGVLVILRPGAGTLGLGHLAAVASTLFYALSVIVLRRIGAAEPGGGLLLAQMAGLLLATAPTLPFVYTAPHGRDLALMALAGAFNGFAQIGLLKA
ncbi:MAG: DMT family transporter, partial [Rhodospirillaceae bacterium]|nr:DMT family transporter [Rhodospirillaceae bacterium]